MHRDLKPENIFIENNGRILISNFGSSTNLDNSLSKTDDFIGTLLYMSPERLHKQQYTLSADVWSAGLILLELLVGNGNLVFNGNNEQ